MANYAPIQLSGNRSYDFYLGAYSSDLSPFRFLFYPFVSGDEKATNKQIPINSFIEYVASIEYGEFTDVSPATVGSWENWTAPANGMLVCYVLYSSSKFNSIVSVTEKSITGDYIPLLYLSGGGSYGNAGNAKQIAVRKGHEYQLYRSIADNTKFLFGERRVNLSAPTEHRRLLHNCGSKTVTLPQYLESYYKDVSLFIKNYYDLNIPKNTYYHYKPRRTGYLSLIVVNASYTANGYCCLFVDEQCICAINNEALGKSQTSIVYRLSPQVDYYLYRATDNIIFRWFPDDTRHII